MNGDTCLWLAAVRVSRVVFHSVIQFDQYRISCRRVSSSIASSRWTSTCLLVVGCLLLQRHPGGPVPVFVLQGVSFYSVIQVDQYLSSCCRVSSSTASSSTSPSCTSTTTTRGGASVSAGSWHCRQSSLLLATRSTN